MNKTTSNVIELLLNLGIPKSAITSYEIDKHTKRKRDEDYNQLNILGYELSRQVEVDLTNLEIYPKLIAELIKLDFVSGFSAQFDTSKRDQVSTELISIAASNAKRKAEIMANGLGVKLDSVFAFNDSGSFDSFFATFGLNEKFGVESFAMAAERSRAADLIFIPKFIEVKKQVNVIYKLQ
jgi:uncharacterized protein YggE